ncbi:MAG: hypothetical protein EOP55_09365 [Sphingobacteriales bacterium]|nr:MAG: hypothetical protein EOP55_09365 [Sphingobacteriales bacterium]
MSSKSENGKAKGRLQIIKQIDNLIDDPLLTNQLQLKNMKSVNVYPVIICSDINVNLSGVNTFLNEGFEVYVVHGQVPDLGF